MEIEKAGVVTGRGGREGYEEELERKGEGKEGMVERGKMGGRERRVEGDRSKEEKWEGEGKEWKGEIGRE